METFALETQLKSQWCWAAVAAGVDAYFAGKKQFTQCEVAGRFLKLDCCQDAQLCDVPKELELAFAHIDRELPPPLDGRLSFPELKNEIDSGRPVCARVGWRSGGGHFVVLYGYRESRAGRQLVLVADPFFPDSILDYDVFASAYQRVGRWTLTFLMGDQKELR